MTGQNSEHDRGEAEWSIIDKELQETPDMEDTHSSTLSHGALLKCIGRQTESWEQDRKGKKEIPW